MEAEAASLSLKLAAEPQNVRQARDEAASYAEGLGLASPGVEDLKTIISEACSNIVRHAYPEDAEERPMEVEMKKTDGELMVTVRDSGTGIRPPTGARPSSLRLGFILMGSLADFLQLRTGRGQGTELLMKVPLHPAS
ncbi:MAG TPA: ATP-binding protein [Solirubrobacterales bacterium]|nr:ATP-binding protein [Solirubrobacterales bacterium]